MFGITRAPELHRAGMTWLNVDRPLCLADLRGRLVVLDFWTFCCINCFHVVPVLEKLEATYGDELTVIGVHSPKFPHERDPDALAGAIARYGVRHPVVHDPDLVLWQEYAVRAWPTLVLISPDGRLIGQLSGEPHPDLLIQGMGDMLAGFWHRGEMRPRPLAVEPLSDGGGRLRFPGKIKPCPMPDGSEAWMVADAGHHQVVVLDQRGGELARYGTGSAGWLDGEAGDAMFNGPEGVACDAAAIYVADTRNHLIRRIDRASGWVTTIAGIGCRGGILRHPEPAAECALASPWDVAVIGRALYFANAGSHQLAVLGLDSHMVTLAAGTGGENIIDGAAEDALLAQPSGLALSPDETALYFVDAETSAVRRLDLAQRQVTTLAGAGLFEFGHVNGDLSAARFQHPMGLAVADGCLYVADSYNSAVRRIDLAAGTVADLPLADCAEPAGIAVARDGRLLLSDTNRHRVLQLSPGARTWTVWAE